MQDVKSKVSRHSVHFRISHVLSDFMDVYGAIPRQCPVGDHYAGCSLFCQRHNSGRVFRKHSAAQLPQATLSKDDMTKKDHRDVQTRLIPASTPLHLLTTFNCTLFKNVREINHKSGGTHKLCLFPSQASLSIPLAQHHQRT